MTKLTPSQRELLTLAAAADDGAIETPAGAKNKVAALIKRGFIILLPQDGGQSQLLITDAGRTALGAPNAASATPLDPAAGGQPIATESNQAGLKGKIGVLVELLRRDGGAGIEAMMAATGWQAHSVRGAMSGAIKKGLGLAVISEKTDGVRLYRLAPQDAA